MNSLEDVYKMTWREFQLRLMGYERELANKHRIARQMTYYAGYALHVNKPKPIEQFWGIGSEKRELADDIRERMKAVMNREREKVRKLQIQ